MTAAKSDHVGQPRPVNRLFLNTFWRIHRAMFRVTGGRIGLQRPERGDKFGMLRIHTLGRKTGKERITMLGYFEDGQNLVTLAMNGWGTSEPAWWLNLQADPHAVVELAGGTRREVVGRAALGAERERLWARWRALDKNLDGYAARRRHETAVVVLEPPSTEPSATPPDRSAAAS